MESGAPRCTRRRDDGASHRVGEKGQETSRPISPLAAHTRTNGRTYQSVPTLEQAS